MRIDYVITGLEIGGAEYQVVSLLEQLALRGHQLRLISLIPPTSAIFIERLVAAGVTLRTLNMRSGKDLPIALLRLRKEFQRCRPEIVHSHMVHANLLTRLVRLLMPSLKIICTSHSINEGGKLRDWSYRLTNPLSQLNTTISDAATRRFIEEKVFPSHKTHTVPNGINTDKFSPIHTQNTEPNQAFRWLAVGRLVEPKDYPTLITAFNQLVDSRLLIAGKGPLLSLLQQQVKQNGLVERIEFLGVCNHVEMLYRQVDGFVLSSTVEGYGLVVAEAMASGLPVVVTDSGGPGEIVGSTGEYGLLVPIKDPDALAKAMASIEMMTLQERQVIGQRARKRIKDKYALNKIVKQWENIYTGLKNIN